MAATRATLTGVQILTDALVAFQQNGDTASYDELAVQFRARKEERVPSKQRKQLVALIINILCLTLGAKPDPRTHLWERCALDYLLCHVPGSPHRGSPRNVQRLLEAHNQRHGGNWQIVHCLQCSEYHLGEPAGLEHLDYIHQLQRAEAIYSFYHPYLEEIEDGHPVVILH